jgi:hypothetical protein
MVIALLPAAMLWHYHEMKTAENAGVTQSFSLEQAVPMLFRMKELEKNVNLNTQYKPCKSRK